MSASKNQPVLGSKKSSIDNKTSFTKPSFWSKSVPLYLFLIVLLSFLSLLFYNFQQKTKADSIEMTNDSDEINEPNIKVVREKGQNLTHPLLFVEIESQKTFDPLKLKLNNYLGQKKQENVVRSASVYVKDLDAGIYLDIDSDSLYDPASLMKVPMLILYLKQAETNPGLLKKTFKYKQNPKNSTVETITDKTLIDGKSYTVEELLYYMIVYSDNEAFWILCDNIDESKIIEFDETLKIPKNIDVIHFAKSNKHYISNANSVAHYFNVLYNASFLNNSLSSYALNLLTKTTFKDGIMKGIPQNMIVAHKFGERTIAYQVDNHLETLQSEFHDFGIVYMKDRPYIVGVMTRGQDLKQLQQVVADVSKIVFDELSSN